jgi:hypothetical protein
VLKICDQHYLALGPTVFERAFDIGHQWAQHEFER